MPSRPGGLQWEGVIGYFPTNVWVGYAAVALLVILAGELGRHLGLRWQRHHKEALAPDLTTLEAAALGLLALMIGFTFSMALTRFDARVKGVVDEANAIGTVALRAQMLPAPHASEVHRLLADYLQDRLKSIGRPVAASPFDNSARKSSQLQAELWDHAVTLAAAQPNSLPVELFATSLNQMIDLQEGRSAAEGNHVPSAVLILLYGVAVVTVGLSGYVAGLSGRAARVPHAIMALMIAFVIAMIDDLDRSQSGFITVEQQALTSISADFAR